MTAPLLEVNDLKMHFPIKSGLFSRAKTFNRAVDGVSLSIQPGETVGLVGESGCGKSTLGRCIARLYQPTEGRVYFKGNDLVHLSHKALLPYRQNIQMIFQDPMESLNARHTIGEILEEPFIIHGIGDAQSRRRSVAKLLDTVGLPSRSATRYPFEFSGGQRQRIGIARAIALNPELIICDEPVSALDVSIQSQILNLLMDLQQEYNLAYLFIAHDLAVVKQSQIAYSLCIWGKLLNPQRAKRFINRLYIPIRNPLFRLFRSRTPIEKPTASYYKETCLHPLHLPQVAGSTPVALSLNHDAVKLHRVCSKQRLSTMPAVC